MLPEDERNNLTDFVSIVALALTASLISSLIFTPEIYKLVIERNKEKIQVESNSRRKNKIRLLKWRVKILNSYQVVIGWIAHYRKTFIVVLILLFGTPVFMIPEKWENHNWYNRTFGSDLYIEDIRPYVDMIFGGSLRLFTYNVFERNIYREPERTKLYVIAELPFGNTIEQMNRILTGVEQYLGTIRGIDKYVTNIYSGQNARIEIFFEEAFEKSTLPNQLKSKLIDRSLDWGGVDWRIYGVGQGFSNAFGEQIPSFKVLMKGYNYDELERQAEHLKQKLLKHNRIQKVNINDRLDYSEKSSQEYVLQFNNEVLALTGSNLSEVLHQLRDSSKPTNTAGYLVMNSFRYPIFLKEKNSNNFSTWRMMDNAVRTTQMKSLKLSSVAQLSLQKVNNAINKKDRQYLRVVGFDYNGSSKLGEKYLTDKLDEMENEMPAGYTAEIQARGLDLEKLKRQYSILIFVIIANFIICSVLFENLKQPFLVIITIPIAFIGLFLTFGLFNFYFDQGGYAAFLMLGGLIANSAIFILNDFNNQLVKGRNLNRRLLKTIANRGRTIFITTISACCGMIPFLIEGQSEIFWFALAAGTIGGLVMSMFSVFVVLPVLMFNRPTSLTVGAALR
jgi:multidrug efflux pump subunit AcrB